MSPATEAPREIAIAGAGLIGRLLGWRLAREGRAVTFFDRDLSGVGAAAWVAGGMLAAGSEAAAHGERILSAGARALETWRVWLAELEADGAGRVAFGDGGSLVVAHRGDEAEYMHFKRRLRGLGESAAWREVEGEALARLEPQLRPVFKRAIFLENEAWIDNRRLLAALETAARARGAKFECAEVLEVRPGSLRYRGPGGAVRNTRDFDLLVDARGAGAVGDWPSLRAVRGEVIRLRAPEVELSRPLRLLHPRYNLYIVPRPDDHFVIGATEVESADGAAVRVRSALELLSALFSAHSGFAEAEILELNSAHRAAFGDNWPRCERQPGLLRLNGLYRHGFLLAPMLLRQAMEAPQSWRRTA